jgi:hypothetical protein
MPDLTRYLADVEAHIEHHDLRAKAAAVVKTLDDPSNPVIRDLAVTTAARALVSIEALDAVNTNA